ncbi:MAG: DUF58 domain-containing protein [Vicinamibacterales bacterium]
MSGHVPLLTGAARSVKSGVSTQEGDTPLVSLNDITEIELFILRRMREMTIGDHRALAHGSGFDYVGLRAWQAGDRFSTIDWAQSSLTNFSPLIVREFEQPSTATVMVVADGSLSTRCGVHGVPIARGVARALATIGMSAVFFQDLFGMITFDASIRDLSAVRPMIGRNHVIHCLNAYQTRIGLQQVPFSGSLSMTLGSFMRKTGLVVFVSDFLFDEAADVIRELSLLNSTHDVIVALVDAAFAFEMPPVNAGWIETVDVETGRTRTVSRAAFGRMAGQVRGWQERVAGLVRDADIDVVRVSPDAAATDLALSELVAERRLKKVA